ncbi:MAG: hypothetical protein C5B47_07775 [Verrucomicrobia bacterium]|nr:MAG: hypothetical protein C5B47_07775 [Verrucomicrobiota bacterium]
MDWFSCGFEEKIPVNTELWEQPGKTAGQSPQPLWGDLAGARRRIKSIIILKRVRYSFLRHGA